MMDFIWEVLAIGGGALVAGGSYLFAHKTAPARAEPTTFTAEGSDIPLIEIDGNWVPHPTVLARRQKNNIEI